MNNNQVKDQIKTSLFERLKSEKIFWSYDPEKVSLNRYNDDKLIADTLRYLDIEDINVLFQIYSYNRIKKAWVNLLIPEGEYLYTLNRFIAWYYFKIKSPDKYLKSMQTRHFNKMFMS